MQEMLFKPSKSALGPDGSGKSFTALPRLILQRKILVPAFKLALVVGTVLNVINNGEQLWIHHTLNLWNAALNYVVPFCVSSYSAARHEARSLRGD